MTIRSPKTPRRAGRAAAAGIAALLVTALLGLAEPASAATPTATPSTLQATAWQTGEATAPGKPPEDERREDERDRDRVLPAVGQLRSESGTCSGTVIGSTSGQLVLTAAHCVCIPEKSAPAGDVRLDFGDKEPGPINGELRFVPGLNGDEEPYARWTVEGEPFVADEWKETGDPRFDVAILRIAKQEDGTAIQDVLTPQNVVFGVGEQSTLSMYGYPAEGRFDDGTTTQERCIDRGGITQNEGVYSMKPCDLTKGSGGGPWINRLDEYNSWIVAVTIAPTPDGTGLHGVPLGESGRKLFQAANSAGEDKNDNENNSKNENNDNGRNGDNNNGRNNDEYQRKYNE